MKTNLLAIVLFFCTTQMFYSQEDGVVSLALPVRNSLTFNQYAINPTFSFVRQQNKYISIYNKREWVQFDDAPLTYLASYSGRFKENIGAGIGLFQQNYGVLTTFGGILNFAYNAKLAQDSNLTFGINIGAYKSGIDKGKVVTNFQDPSLENIPSNFLLSVSPGINYGTAFLDFGVSVNNLVLYNFKSSELIQDNPEQSFQAHIMYTGYMNSRGFFDESRFSGLVKSEFKKDKTVISGIAMLAVPKGIWAQVGYNTLYGAIGGIGLNITKQISIEYSFEKALGDLSDFGPSHDITLAYKFKNKDSYDYSVEDEVAALFSSDNKRRPVSHTSKVKTEAETKISTQAKLEAEIDAQEKLATEAKAKAEADAQAKFMAEAKAKIDAEARAKLAAEANAKREADAQAKLLAEAKSKKAAEEKAKAQARIAAEAQAQTKLAAVAKAKADEEARLVAETEAKNAEDELAKALAEAEKEKEAKLIAEVQAKKDAEEKATIEAEAQAKLVADTKAKVEAEAQVILAAKAKAEADAKAKEELVSNPTDEIGKSMSAIAKSTEDSKSTQKELLTRLSDVVASKNKDLKDLKEENDLSEKGIYMAPKPFKSLTAENNALEIIKSDLDKIIKERNDKIKELESLYNQRLDTITMDEVNLYYNKAIKTLKSEQLIAVRSKAALETRLEEIKIATDFERKRRIKRAAYNNEEDRFYQDKAALSVIKKNTPLSKVPLKAEDFDFGEEQSSNIQILKNVKNVENGYYLIVSVHSDVVKRDDFLTKVVASGQSNIDFFYDVNTSKYFIYYEKFDFINGANEAMKSKGNTAFNGKMSIIKIEN